MLYTVLRTPKGWKGVPEPLEPPLNLPLRRHIYSIPQTSELRLAELTEKLVKYSREEKNHQGRSQGGVSGDSSTLFVMPCYDVV